MTLPPLGELVRCDWIDIVIVNNWQDKDKMEELGRPHPAVSIGWLSHIGDDYIIISATVSLNDPDQYNNHISIPLGCIKEVTVV